jgi:4-hydroxy-tetrahydrodipicolinate reductase
MRLLLIGYGKMGKAIEAFALERKHSIAGRLDPVSGHSFDFKTPVDAAIEFTTPASAEDNIRLCIDKNIPVLSGTTGWISKKKEMDEYCRSKGGTFFYASNYSLGVNMFFKLNEQLARMMASLAAYDVSIDETHHTQKKDAPSGTAITLAEGILKYNKSKQKWVNRDSQTAGELSIQSFREDPAPGTHVVHYRSALDDIEIKHTAHSREGFALGAIHVAEWLPAQKGVLGMDDFLKF